MSNEKPAAAYPRLCVAYFFQFAIWGSWGVALGGYAGATLGFSPTQVGWLYSAIPLGAIISPLFVGPIVDRYFAAQKMIALLHLLGGACLLAAAFTTDFNLLLVLMILHGVFYMPTIALVNSVVFKHLPKSENAPLVFVFGTIGWIAINLVVDCFLGGMTTAGFLYMGASASFFLAVYSLTLPNTPPKPVSAEGRGDALGLGALKLFRDPVFLIFVACAFVASIPACNYYFPAMGKMLSERDYPSPLSLGTLNQVSELLFMAALPFFVVRLGLKRVLLIGMLAWAVRYLCFTQDAFGFALVGLLLHGFCYSFLYVGAYMYGEKKAPEDLKASVQSLLTFLLLGVGQMLGAQWEGFAERRAAPAFTEMQIAASEAGVQMPGWVNPKLQDSNFKYLDLSGNVKRWMGQDQAAQLKDIGTELDSNQDNILTREELAAVDDKGVTFGETNFTRDDLLANFKAIAAWKAEKKPDEVGDDWQVARDDYIAAQRADWAQVFLVPSLFIFAVAAVFLIFGKDPEAEDKQ